MTTEAGENATETEDLGLDGDLGSVFDELTASDEGEAPAEAPVEPAEALTEETDPNVAVEDPATPEGVVEPPQLPEHWSREDREMFIQQTPEAQAFLLARHKSMESDYTRKRQKDAEDRRQHEAQVAYAQQNQQIWKDLERNFAAQGFDLTQGQRYVANIFNQYLQNPKETILQLAQVAGIEMPQPGTPASDDPFGETAPSVDPRVQQELAQARQLALQTAQRQQAIEQEQLKRQQNEAYQQVQATIKAFAEEKTPTGETKYPHFPALQKQMGTIMQANGGLTMEQAYQLALNERPELRKAETMASKVRKAKQTAGGVRRSGSGGKAAADMSLSEELSAMYDQLSS